MVHFLLDPKVICNPSLRVPESREDTGTFTVVHIFGFFLTCSYLATIHSSHKYLLETCFVPGTLQGGGNLSMSQQNAALWAGALQRQVVNLFVCEIISDKVGKGQYS